MTASASGAGLLAGAMVSLPEARYSMAPASPGMDPLYTASTEVSSSPTGASAASGSADTGAVAGAGGSETSAGGAQVSGADGAEFAGDELAALSDLTDPNPLSAGRAIASSCATGPISDSNRAHSRVSCGG